MPTGFMPELGADGWVTMQLCTVQGLVPRRVQIEPLDSVTKNLFGSEPAPHDDRADCAYALTAGASPATGAPGLPDFVSIATLSVTAGLAIAAAQRLARSQSARGPPASVG
ncbi:MAG: hypothetical protein R3E65_02680 [Steroidobacteraceae bacterium]